MTETDFLDSYDPAEFPRLAVAVDVVLLTTINSELHLLLVKRAEQPALDQWALPGTFVGEKEALDKAPARALRQKVGVDAPVRQFKAFGAVKRDPRMRVISVAFMAALPVEQVSASLRDYRLVRVMDGEPMGEGGQVMRLPFDHADMIAAAAADVRLTLDHTSWVFNFLPPEFSLRELQQVHEAIRGRSVNKPAFRKRMLESGWLEATGRLETGKGFRPAELYRARSTRGERD